VQAVAFVAEHCPHAPVGWQAGVAPPHSPSPAQARHVCVAVLHTGAVPPHCASEMQGTQIPEAAKQTGVAPPHFVVFVAEHCPHAPDDWQAGVAPPHSPSPAQARQVCVTVLHTGVVPPHCALDVHGTQVALAVSQTGVAPVHLVAFVAEQAPHEPLGWQAGVAPPQSASLAQARHVRVVRLHTGVVPPQYAFEVQGTQSPLAVKQAGLAPVQAVAFVAEHSVHDPFGWQAGVAPPHSPSPAQARHV
jgi:hypothetical protein